MGVRDGLRLGWGFSCGGVWLWLERRCTRGRREGWGLTCGWSEGLLRVWAGVTHFTFENFG